VEDDTNTRADRIIAAVKDHRIAAWLIVAGVALLSVGQLAGAFKNVRDLLLVGDTVPQVKKQLKEPVAAASRGREDLLDDESCSYLALHNGDAERPLQSHAQGQKWIIGIDESRAEVQHVRGYAIAVLRNYDAGPYRLLSKTAPASWLFEYNFEDLSFRIGPSRFLQQSYAWASRQVLIDGRSREVNDGPKPAINQVSKNVMVRMFAQYGIKIVDCNNLRPGITILTPPR
jgi:hypothetical protein